MGTDLDKRVDVLERTEAYRGHLRIDVLRLRHGLFEGGMGPEIQREVVKRGHAVLVLPYDPRRDEVVLIEQFRVAPFEVGDDPWMLEAVAGLIEDGEDMADVVRREAKEEAGLDLEDVERVITVFTSPGVFSEQITVFHALVDSSAASGVHGVAEEGEDIRVVVMPFVAAIKAMDSGRITSGPTVIALQWLALHRDRIRSGAK